MTDQRTRPPSKLATLSGIFGSGLRLAAIAGLVVGALASIDHLTRPRITHNQQRALVASLVEITGESRLEAIPFESPLPAYLHICDASEAGEASGSLQTRFQLVRASASGYAGTIEFTIALAADDQILGVRVNGHTETPGLGDAIETDKSDWIHQLAGRRRADASGAQWAVRQDGGTFDAITGATITSRAILSGVSDALAGLPPPSETTCTPL